MKKFSLQKFLFLFCLSLAIIGCDEQAISPMEADDITSGVSTDISASGNTNVEEYVIGVTLADGTKFTPEEYEEYKKNEVRTPIAKGNMRVPNFGDAENGFFHESVNGKLDLWDIPSGWAERPAEIQERFNGNDRARHILRFFDVFEGIGVSGAPFFYRKFKNDATGIVRSPSGGLYWRHFRRWRSTQYDQPMSQANGNQLVYVTSLNRDMYHGQTFPRDSYTKSTSVSQSVTITESRSVVTGFTGKFSVPFKQLSNVFSGVDAKYELNKTTSTSRANGKSTGTSATYTYTQGPDPYNPSNQFYIKPEERCEVRVFLVPLAKLHHFWLHSALRGRLNVYRKTGGWFSQWRRHEFGENYAQLLLPEGMHFFDENNYNTLRPVNHAPKINYSVEQFNRLVVRQGMKCFNKNTNAYIRTAGAWYDNAISID